MTDRDPYLTALSALPVEAARGLAMIAAMLAIALALVAVFDGGGNG